MKTMWDERYKAAGFAYGDKPNDFLVEQAHRIPKGPVLCLAEGGRTQCRISGRKRVRGDCSGSVGGRT